MVHDEFCPCVTVGIYETCRCDYIDSISRRERRSLIADGWVSGEQHEALIATTRARTALGMGGAIVQGILAARHGEDCECMECMSMVRAAQIAEGISRDFA